MGATALLLTSLLALLAGALANEYNVGPCRLQIEPRRVDKDTYYTNIVNGNPKQFKDCKTYHTMGDGNMVDRDRDIRYPHGADSHSLSTIQYVMAMQVPGLTDGMVRIKSGGVGNHHVELEYRASSSGKYWHYVVAVCW